jgi:hypothetical protein
LKMIAAEGARVERRRTAVVEIRKHLAGLYRGFVWWASLYGDVDDHYEKERRELSSGFTMSYPTSIYRGQCGSRKVAARGAGASSGCRKSSAPSSPRR